MAVGMSGYLGIGVESSGGGVSGAYSATVMDYVPFLTEGLTLQRNDLPDNSITANFYKRRVYNGLQRVEGPVNAQAHPLYSGYFLRAATDVTTSVVGSPGLASSHSNVREHRFTCLGTQQFHTGSGSDLPTLTIEVNRGPVMGAGSSFLYYNCAANALEFTVQAGQITTMNAEFIGRDYGGKPRSTPVYVPQDAFLWNTASVSVNAASKPIYESLTVRVQNNLEAVPTLDGRLRPDLVKRNNFGQIVVNGTVSFRDTADYDNFVAGSQYLLRVTCTGKQISSTPTNNEIFDITVPQFRYSTFPVQIGGPGRISVGFTGEGVMDPTSNYAAQFSLVNTRVSNYAVNTNA